MPTYEYTCDACGNAWEAEQKMSEAPLRDCPKCGKSKAKRLISGGHFMLKGEGWSKDLYHKPAPKKSGTESGGSGGSGPSGSESSGSGPASSGGNASGTGSKAAASA